MIGGNLLKMLSSSKNQLNKIIKERQNKADYLKLMNLELSKLRNKLIIYFICVYILGIFFLYGRFAVIITVGIVIAVLPTLLSKISIILVLWMFRIIGLGFYNTISYLFNFCFI